MIRRDYILRMIEEFMQVLSRLNRLKREELWNEARSSVDEEFNQLVGGRVEELAQLSQTELLARLIQSGPSQSVRTKTAMLTTLLKEAGDVAEGEGRTEESREYYLKGLQLLLLSLAGGVEDWPEFVPKVESFVAGLRDAPLPSDTQALLMQHYEQTGQFAKAEDAFYVLLESDPGNPRIIQFGISFYHRLAGQSDASLEGGGLPRAEVEAGLTELQKSQSQ
jgi:tetratricopeptide (TPR) repeat protein